MFVFIDAGGDRRMIASGRNVVSVVAPTSLHWLAFEYKKQVAIARGPASASAGRPPKSKNELACAQSVRITSLWRNGNDIEKKERNQPSKFLVTCTTVSYAT